MKSQIHNKEHSEKKETILGKKLDFFAYQRDIQKKVDAYIANNWFIDQEELKEFLYNENQENPDWIIMEINTVNAGWPGLLEMVDQADEEYVKTENKSRYARFIKKLHNSSLRENDKKYFENYILSELKNKNAEKIILVFNWWIESCKGIEDPDILIKNMWLNSEYAKFISLKNIHEIIKDKKFQVENTLLMGHGFTNEYRPHQYNKKFQEIFWKNYINQEEPLLSSKLRPSIFGRKDMSGSYFSKKEIDEMMINAGNNLSEIKKDLQQNYIVKMSFVDQWAWIFFPGEREFLDDNTIKSKKWKIIKYYALQKFHELPRKLSIDKEWGIIAKSVDVRAFVTFDTDKHTINIQLFWREGKIWKVSNVSAGGKFTKIYTVKDSAYYPMIQELNDLIMHTWTSQHNAIEKFFDTYAKNNLVTVSGAKISPIPFIISETAAKKIGATINTLVDRMIETWIIYKTDEEKIFWTTMMGVDLSINPLPKNTK